MEVISFGKYLASPEYRKYPYDGLVGWLIGKFPPSVADLQSKYDFAYYSSMNAAVTAVNNGTANADATKETAVAGVYTDKSGGKNVVLLKDATETSTISVSKDMTINLGGHAIRSTAATCINVTAGNVTIDGRLDGSSVNVFGSGSMCFAIQTSASSTVEVCGGSYEIENNTTNSMNLCMYALGDLKLTKCKITAASSNGMAGAIQHSGRLSASCCIFSAYSEKKDVPAIKSISTATIALSNCKVIATSVAGTVIGISIYGIATLSNCDIRAYSNYLYGDETYYEASSSGVSNKGTLTINDCYVFGTHCGLSNHGTLYVNGGTYEGYGHGGFYFAGTGTTSYARNAVIRDCDMPDGYTATATRNGAGFYIGGAADNNNNNVYMDNCKIHGSNLGQVFVLRGSSGEVNNSLYISNSTIDDGARIRIDNDTHKLYIGKGNNFTAEDTSLPSAVVETDDVYVRVG